MLDFSGLGKVLFFLKFLIAVFALKKGKNFCLMSCALFHCIKHFTVEPETLHTKREVFLRFYFSVRVPVFYVRQVHHLKIYTYNFYKALRCSRIRFLLQDDQVFVIRYTVIKLKKMGNTQTST